MGLIQAASTHDSFDASTLGAFTESALKARGSALGPWIALQIILQSVDQWDVTIWVPGDQTAIFTGSQEAEISEDGTPRSWLAIRKFDGTTFVDADELLRGGDCGTIATPDGYTFSIHSVSSTGDTTVLNLSSAITVDIDESDKTLVIRLDPTTHCRTVGPIFGATTWSFIP